jgi:hypothetical protein
MGNELDLLAFATDIQQAVISLSEGKEQLREDAFTEIYIDYLREAGEFDDGVVCQHRSRGIQVNGYGVSEDEECLDLFVSLATNAAPPETVPKREIEACFKRLLEFFARSLAGYAKEMEEASPAFDLALRIVELKSTLTRIRLFLFTDGVSKMETIPNDVVGDMEVSFQVWDIERLYRCWTSGKRRETIEIDFVQEWGQPLPCLPAAGKGATYECYLTVLPGPLLVGLYSKYGPRLLERNVRCFLQARGKINKGIRNSILNEPDMFLAYNNGLSATAEKVSTTKLPDGTLGISSARDFQIVNGGQTTGSIYHAFRKDDAEVTALQVPVKLTVLLDQEHVESVVPKISEYANSQNKVNIADFQANDKYHVALEEKSRTIWAPAAEGMQRQTHWYYERARGQYQDDRSRARTPGQQKQFDLINPKSQMFTKTDLAKFENTWAQYPHLVSRGAQKNFWEFTLVLQERGNIAVDDRYFQLVVAKAILFRSAEKIVQSQHYGGYRANVVTYTLAFLARKTQQRIDLDRIWREQHLTPSLEDAIRTVSTDVHQHITQPPNGANITEWCKKEECWKRLADLDIPLPKTLAAELIHITKMGDTVDRGIHALSGEDKRLITEIGAVPADVWFRISKWAKETSNLQGWQRSLAYSVGRIIANGREPSIKQAVQAKKILAEAERLGCDVNTGGKSASP